MKSSLLNILKPELSVHFHKSIRIAFACFPENSGLNLAGHTGSDFDLVSQARLELQQVLPELKPVQYLRQEHTTQIFNLDSEAHQIQESACDGVMSAESNRACAVLTADCLPVLMATKDGKCIAAVHAGWRGLAQGIIQKAIHQLNSQDLSVYIGPAIQQRHFEVGEEVRETFQEYLALDTGLSIAGKQEGKWLLDLPGIARQILLQSGVNADSIMVSDICTFESSMWPSYRQNKTIARMASLIWKECSDKSL